MVAVILLLLAIFRSPIIALVTVFVMAWVLVPSLTALVGRASASPPRP